MSARRIRDISPGDALHVRLRVIPRFRGEGLGFPFGPHYGLLARVAAGPRQVSDG